MPNYIFSASPITTDGSYEFTGSPGSISVAENVNATITLTDVSKMCIRDRFITIVTVGIIIIGYLFNLLGFLFI